MNLVSILGINFTFGNPTYTPTVRSKDEILQYHRSVLDTFNIPINGIDKYELPYPYWIPKLHKKLLKKQRYKAGSSKCSTKLLSLHLTKILTAVKEKRQKYCATTYARGGANQMWILKNFKELIANLKAQNVSQINSIKVYDFSTLYTTIPNEKLAYHRQMFL
jgi:hypothetical protein